MCWLKEVLPRCSVIVERISDPELSQLGLCMLQLVGLLDRVSGVHQVSVYNGLWRVVGGGGSLVSGGLDRCLLVGKVGLCRW